MTEAKLGARGERRTECWPAWHILAFGGGPINIEWKCIGVAWIGEFDGMGASATPFLSILFVTLIVDMINYFIFVLGFLHFCYLTGRYYLSFTFFDKLHNNIFAAVAIWEKR